MRRDRLNCIRANNANMEAKLLFVLVIAINCYTSCGAALRRTPKVYNALITTDENLTSSRAFPVIQPTIHETGIAQYPFGPYNPYEYYSQPLVRFGQPIAPGLVSREQLPFPLTQQTFPPQVLQQHQHPQPQQYPGYPHAQNPPTAPSEQQPTVENTAPTKQQQQQPVKPPSAQPEQNPPSYIPVQQQDPQQMPKEKLPISLNAYGLPPALIPFQQYPNHHRSPVQLPPYGFNQYPLIYDPITGYREQYLPPYNYYPSHSYAFGPAPSAQQQPQQPTTAVPTSAPSPPSTPLPYADETTADETNDVTAQTPPADDFESIKNVSKNKNRAVPDVPPPPIPSGAKAKQVP